MCRLFESYEFNPDNNHKFSLTSNGKPLTHKYGTCSICPSVSLGAYRGQRASRVTEKVIVMIKEVPYNAGSKTDVHNTFTPIATLLAIGFSTSIDRTSPGIQR